MPVRYVTAESVVQRRIFRVLASLVGLGLLALLLFSTVLPVPGRSGPFSVGGPCNGTEVGRPLFVDPAKGSLGTVRSCRPLALHTYVFDIRHPRAYLLVDTDHGLVALRITLVRRVTTGKLRSATHTEVTADDAPNLSRTERDQLRADIAARGGLAGSWTVEISPGRSE